MTKLKWPALLVRQTFLDFFASKGHKIVPSAPLVNKDDPTLMFTNAGMNQFKDYFLGNKLPAVRRIADTQKCLRVSGKHNDLEDVGFDGTHHTMFEMLGNWSFGDYFKEEAIAWSWELLTEVFGLPADRLYATVFEGDASDGLPPDEEAKTIWNKFVPLNHIIYGNKKDNFWEMGDTGPCGPCTEIHIDLRSDEERAKIPGEQLVNKDDPRVIEIWNNVFIQFNRKADKSLDSLPEKHVDTGMGFERLCLILQGKQYTYDTDVFTPMIRQIEAVSGIAYKGSYDRSAKSDVAMRVVSDHIRAVAFAIADGQLLGNSGAGYVIRRILRRAVRYYFSFLNLKEPFLYTLIPILADSFADVFPELKAQQEQVSNIILSEERAFLNTLENGLKRIDALEVADQQLDGQTAFELYDTFGFPIDLTRLIAAERGWTVDEKGFNQALEAQKQRSKADAVREVGDWTVLLPGVDTRFVGYDTLEVGDARVVKYRTVKDKKGDNFQIVLDVTPFYPEGGGQVGDTGVLKFGGETIKVIDTKKENDLVIHFVHKLPAGLETAVQGVVDASKRHLTENNHSATHLLHAALREVLGAHVQQKGSLVNAQYLRFDFSHFQKVSDEELTRIEEIVNTKIRENIPLEEARNLPIDEAKRAGAMMLFGEKYGETVRMITFDPGYSRELCGGCHVPATGKIGLLKITSEGAVASGVRRVEAVTADGAEQYLRGELEELRQIRDILKTSQAPSKQVAALQDENKQLRKEIEKLVSAQAAAIQGQLRSQAIAVNGVNFLSARVPLSDADALKTLAFNLEKDLDNAVVVLAALVNDKPQLLVAISKNLTESKGLHAGNMVRELAKEIKGGGGGQPFFASAGGSDPSGLDRALSKAKSMIGG